MIETFAGKNIEPSHQDIAFFMCSVFVLNHQRSQFCPAQIEPQHPVPVFGRAAPRFR